MEVKQILTDKNNKNIPEKKENTLDAKNENEISEFSPVYTFCKSISEINNKTENGWSPVYRAIMSNNKKVLEELLKLGANPNIPNNLGETPLYLCIESENFELFKILLKYGVDPNIQKRNGDTPLHLIIKKKLENKYIFEILKRNANPNIQNKLYEQSPTHLILINKYEKEILLNFWKNNADIFNIKDKYDKSPFDYAKELNDNKYLEIISNIFGDKNEPKIYVKEEYNQSSNKSDNDNELLNISEEGNNKLNELYNDKKDFNKSEKGNELDNNNNDNINTNKSEKGNNDLNELDYDSNDNNNIIKTEKLNNNLKISGNKYNSLNKSEKEENNLIEMKLEKKFNFEIQSISSENINLDNIKKDEKNKSELKQIMENKNEDKVIEKDREPHIDSLTKIENKTSNFDINENKNKSEKENEKFFNLKQESNNELFNLPKEKEIEKSTEEIIDNNKKEKTNNKESEFNSSHLTYNNEKYKGKKEINLNKYKKFFNTEKDVDKDIFNKTEISNIEKDLEKINYKIFKNIKIITKKKKGEIKKKKKSDYYLSNNNNFFYESKNIDDTEKDISTINNENSFFYEGDETINESYINNNSNKENVDINNLVYHNKNHLATKEKRKNQKEKSLKRNTKLLYKKNLFNKFNSMRFSSPDYKFTYKCFNRNSLIQNNQNIFQNDIDINNASKYNNNSYVYNQYKKNNIIINKNKSSFNKFNYEINSLNNTTFSSVRNNSRNNIKSLINRNSITSNSFSNNSNNIANNITYKNNTSFIINDYYNQQYQKNSYKQNKNNLLIKFRDWLISCDLLCYYNTLVKNKMYNIEKYIDNIRNNKINVITFKEIEEFGIRKPGHIFRLLIKLQVDAGKIDYNIYKFIIDRFNINTMTNNGAMTTSYNEINCLGLNCCLSNNNNKKINNNINENEINYFDIFSFLKVNNLWKFKENFIHNGFDQIDYILIQLFSRYSFNKKILNDYMHIYLEEDKNNILKILYKEKNKICSFLGLKYNDDELNKILFNNHMNHINDIYTINNNYNDRDDCCLIF